MKENISIRVKGRSYWMSALRQQRDVSFRHRCRLGLYIRDVSRLGPRRLNKGVLIPLRNFSARSRQCLIKVINSMPASLKENQLNKLSFFALIKSRR